jgi:hypothetical protein
MMLSQYLHQAKGLRKFLPLSPTSGGLFVTGSPLHAALTETGILPREAIVLVKAWRSRSTGSHRLDTDE